MVKIGVIGSGLRMNNVLKSVPGIGTEIQIKKVFDPSEKSIQLLEENFHAAAKRCASYNEVVEDTEISWIFVGSWNCFHAEQVIAAARNGKNIFCEKPLALTIEDCIEIREEIRKAGVHFILGFTLRYSPHYLRIKQVLDDGLLGQIISMEFNEVLDFNHGGYIHGDWRRFTKYAGSHMLEKCCHDIDIVNWLLNSKVSRVASFGGLDFFIPENESRIHELGNGENGKPAYMTWAETENPFTSEKDIVDNQVVLLEYENKVRATFHTNCNSAFPERRMYILGSKGSLRADVMAGTLEIKLIGFDTQSEDLATGVAGGHGGGDVVLGQDIYAAIMQGKTPPTGVEDGLVSAITAFGIDKALASGSVVDMSAYWQQAGIKS